MKFVLLKFRSRLLSGLMVVLMALFIPGFVFSTLGEGIELGTNVTVFFSSVEAGREILTRRDDFIAALTPLDRRARIQTDRDVSEKDFLAFVGRCVQAFRLLVVKPDGTNWVAQRVAGRPRLLRPADTTGWFEQIGRNTRYTIHPGEILADNFVRLINGDTNVPTPQVIAAMANAFSQRASKQ